ncbi:TonB family protein [Povalibacter sp.]|uniref:energy transducer TonB n=1 Tax=Povalibacter sp. TaxID=1962978 RepID=UPI002F3F9177
MLRQNRSRHVTVAAAILSAHIAVIYGLLSIAPRLELGLESTPVAVRFISAPATPKQWTPPEVKVVVANIIAPIPEAPLIEIPVGPPSEQALGVAVRTDVAPTEGDSATPRLISSVEYLREPVPRYPPASRKLREQGLVILRVLIDEHGVACSIEIETSSGFSRLDHAAREAVERAAFRPYVEDGSPRRASVLIPIEFSLNRSSA